MTELREPPYDRVDIIRQENAYAANLLEVAYDEIAKLKRINKGLRRMNGNLYSAALRVSDSVVELHMRMAELDMVLRQAATLEEGGGE